MSFLSKLKSVPLPPLQNVLNVAVQTARQHIPDKKDYEQPPGTNTLPKQNLSNQPQGVFDPNYQDGKYIHFLSIVFLNYD